MLQATNEWQFPCAMHVIIANSPCPQFAAIVYDDKVKQCGNRGNLGNELEIYDYLFHTELT